MINSIPRAISNLAVSAILLSALLKISPVFAGPGPGYHDIPYHQRCSIKYYTDSTIRGLSKVLSDRNGNIQLLSAGGLVQTHAGRLLYPGTLVNDPTCLPLTGKKIADICLSEEQLVFIDDKALFSNGWAGSLYIPHGMPGARILTAGKPGSFLISDGLRLVIVQGRHISWSGRSGTTILDARYDSTSGAFWILTEKSLSILTAKINPVFTGEGFTCFAIQGKNIYIGTHNGYYQSKSPASPVSPVSSAPLAVPKALKPAGLHQRLPASDLTCIGIIDGMPWFGSTEGAFTPAKDGHFDYFASERWLPGNHVTHIAKGPGHSVLILTSKGLGKIESRSMSLEEKAMYYEDIVRQRHIRYGFYSDYTSLRKGDLSTAEMGPHDSDNLWTSMYLVAELFRYLSTGDQEAKLNCRESFDAMERLFTLSGIEGLFGRCIERKGIASFKNEVRKNIEAYWYPGYANTPSSWRHSPDPEWDWRGSASSDQSVGQYFALILVAQYADDDDLRQRAIGLIDKLTGYILDNNLCLVDFDGRPTLWGRWGPEYVNRFPDMVGDKKLYSSNIIAFLQAAYHFTGKTKYRDKALELLHKYHYLENLTRPVAQIGPAPASADAWSRELSGGWNNSDDEMYFLAYWGLYPYALDSSLKSKYKEAIRDHWNYKRPARDGLWNLIYGVLTNAPVFDLDETIWELKRMPMDLITWSTRNSGRLDIRSILPPDERPQNKHNRNLFDPDEKGANGSSELGGGDVFLLPYWMGRYFGIISAPEQHITSTSNPIF